MYERDTMDTLGACENCPNIKKPAPHKHAALIKAWADGAVIQVYISEALHWIHIPTPVWDESQTYRIKPETKPDVIKFTYLSSAYQASFNQLSLHNAKLVFDGETGQLKSVSLISY